MKRMLAVLLVTVSVFLICAVPVFAGNTAKEESDILIESSGIAEVAESLESETKAFLDSIGFEDIRYEALYALDFQTVVQAVLSVFRLSLKEILHAFLSILAAVLLCALAQSFFGGFEKADIQKIYDACTAVFITGVSMLSLSETIAAVGTAVNAAAAFTAAAMPIMCVIAVSQGKALSAAVFNGMAVGVSEVLSSLFSSVFLPLSNILLGVGTVSGIDRELPMEKLIGLVRKYLLSALSVFAGIYFSLLSLKSTVGAAADESAVKALKVAAGNFVPVIGSAVSDSAAVVISSLQLTKTAIGGFGVLALTGMFLPLLFKSVLWYFVFETAAFAASLLSAGSAAAVLKNLSAAVSTLVIIVLFCALMFMMNFGMMMRMRA